MASGIAFLIISSFTFSWFALSYSINVPFEPNRIVSSHVSNANAQLVGDTIDPEEEVMMESGSPRRTLAGRGYISYGALQKNNVPCNQRGHSYYNCNSRGQANPYSRGCNIITRCARR